MLDIRCMKGNTSIPPAMMARSEPVSEGPKAKRTQKAYYDDGSSEQQRNNV